MKRTALLLAMLLPVAASLTSCHKDGVYNPKEKISRIYYAYSSPDPFFNSDKELKEIWDWDGNKLSTIAYYTKKGVDGTEKFSYDGKRLSRVDYVIPDGTNVAHVLYIYDGRKLDKMEYYSGEELQEIHKYIYDGKKLSKVEVTFYDIFAYPTSQMAKQWQTVRSRLFRYAVPEAVCASMDRIVETCINTDTPFRQKEGAYYTWTINLTWEGKNISKVEYYDPTNELISIQYSYDKNSNPIYGCYTMGNLDEECLNAMTCKNNVVSETWNDGDRADYTYQYDGKFPISKSVKWVDDEDIETWYYEYK